jgi:hypothetical protein
MPDLTTETRRICKGNTFWQKRVAGSQGDTYTVLWGPTPGGPYQYGWHCDCKGFQFRQSCKHVAAAELERCTAGEDAFAGGPGLDSETCPKCGGETTIIQITT